LFSLASPKASARLALAGAKSSISNAFDFIVDGHCLEHIALNDDRQRVLEKVRSMLKPQGFYFVCKTVRDPGRDYGDDHISEYGLVCARIEHPDRFEDALMIEDHWYLPNQRHRSPEGLRDELTRSGFRALNQQGGDLLLQLDQSTG
tara:strand:+ start:132 stop:572 length:441 start_codon:yes stop_codon:yes gene_type:complete